MPYLLEKTKKSKKILIHKYNSEEKKQKIMERNENTIDLPTEEDVFNHLVDSEKERISTLFFSPIKDIFLDNVAISLIDNVSAEIVRYIKSNHRIKAIYNFQPEYYDENLNIVKEESGCHLIDCGEFLPLEYYNIEEFMNEYTVNGSIEFDNFYKREIFKPQRVVDAISPLVNINDDMIDNFIDEINTSSNVLSQYINISFQKYFLNTNYFKNYLRKCVTPEIIYFILSGITTDLGKKDFFDIYKHGCELLGESPQNVEYITDFNPHFKGLILDAYKKLDIEKDISMNNFSPAKHNIQKKINRYKRELEKLNNEKIAFSNRLINERLDKYRDILINMMKYKKYCKANSYDVDIDTDSILSEMAKIEAIRYEKDEILINLSDILSNISCVRDLLFKGLNYVVTYTYINEETKKNIIDLIPDSPEKEYPLAREMKRHFFIHYGPTNSGKTYEAIESLKKAETGIYLGPLRLLALEIQDNLNSSNIPCSLLTGEEENIIENANHMASTVEKLDTTKHYDVCVIDECQMIGDSERGFAWTKAILGVQADNIYICMGPEALDLVVKLIELCDDTYELIEHHRRSELVVQEPIKLKKENIEKYDAYIVFSKKKVLQVAAELINMGVKTSMIYGNLPYSVRKKQVERFLNGDTDVIVSTNAIGMGMNLPVRRIVFLEDQKFNGKIKDDLTVSDVKQIAGRAGRNKETGYVTSTLYSNEFIETNLEKNTPKIKKAYLGFSDEIISIDAPLSDILKVWRTISTPDLFKRMNIDRYILLDEKIYLNVTKKEKLKMLTIAFDEKNPYLLDLWKQYCFNYEAKEDFAPPVMNGFELNNYEEYYQALELYYSFSRNFNREIDLDWLNEEKSKISDKINEILVKDAIKFKKRCEICGRPMKWDLPYKTCKKCHFEFYDFY